MSDKLEILKTKDVYPYAWVDSNEKFNYPQLLPKKYFYSSLRDRKQYRNDGHIFDKQYLHLKNVWDTFKFNKFEDFHNHYLQKDVLLLADVFKNFISTSLKYYNLDPCHYFSASGLSCDARWNWTKIELEEISDPDKYIFIEKRNERWYQLHQIHKDRAKEIMNIAQIMTVKKLKHILLTLT